MENGKATRYHVKHNPRKSCILWPCYSVEIKLVMSNSLALKSTMWSYDLYKLRWVTQGSWHSPATETATPPTQVQQVRKVPLRNGPLYSGQSCHDFNSDVAWRCQRRTTIGYTAPHWDTWSTKWNPVEWGNDSGMTATLDKLREWRPLVPTVLQYNL